MAFSPHLCVLLVEVDVVSVYTRKAGRNVVSTHMSWWCESEMATDPEAGTEFIRSSIPKSAFDQNLSLYLPSVLALFSPRLCNQLSAFLKKHFYSNNTKEVEKGIMANSALLKYNILPNDMSL